MVQSVGGAQVGLTTMLQQVAQDLLRVNGGYAIAAHVVLTAIAMLPLVLESEDGIAPQLPTVAADDVFRMRPLRQAWGSTTAVNGSTTASEPFAQSLISGTWRVLRWLPDGRCDPEGPNLSFTQWGLPSMVAVVSVATLFSIIDACLERADCLHYRIVWPGQRKLDNIEWQRVANGAGLSLFNVFFVHAWTKMLLYWPLAKATGYCEPGRALAAVDNLPLLLCKICGTWMVADTWFYWTHRKMHSPRLYRWVHKVHHEFIDVHAWAFAYAHWIEALVVNDVSIMMPPLLMQLPREVTILWMVIAATNAVFSHCGFALSPAWPESFSGDPHDSHHKFRDCDFGAGGMWDWLAQTTTEAKGHGRPLALGSAGKEHTLVPSKLPLAKSEESSLMQQSASSSGTLNPDDPLIHLRPPEKNIKCA